MQYTLNYWANLIQSLVNHMLFGNSPQDTRPLFFSSWKKYQQNESLTALEQQLVNVMIDHPGYHSFLNQAVGCVITKHHKLNESANEGGIEYDNPFLHMGLHLAIRDQIMVDKPLGIASIFNALCLIHHDTHHVEHLMMEPLATCLWKANHDQCLPDEVAYLKACKELLLYVQT